MACIRFVRHWTHEPRIGDDTRYEFASMPLLVDPVTSTFSLAFPRRRCRCDAMFRKCSRFRVENRISAESRAIRVQVKISVTHAGSKKYRHVLFFFSFFLFFFFSFFSFERNFYTCVVSLRLY